MIKKKLINLKRFDFIELLGPFLIIVLYFILGFIGFKNPLDIASILIVSFGLLMIFGFFGLIGFALLFKKIKGAKNYAFWVNNFNNSKINLIIKESLLALAGEVFFVFFGLFVAGSIAIFLGYNDSNSLSLFLPFAYFILSVWSKFVYYFLNDYIIYLALLGFIILPIGLSFFGVEELVFFTAPLGGAPLMQGLISMMREKMYSEKNL